MLTPDQALAYRAWITTHYPTPLSALAACGSATARMQAAFPELRRVRGHCGLNPHWWLVAEDGTIVDPTYHQWDHLAPAAIVARVRYVPLDESIEHPVGRCPNCGDDVYASSGGGGCCTPACADDFARYLGAEVTSILSV